jgi:MYXO-CTERM domain-containing protein
MLSLAVLGAAVGPMVAAPPPVAIEGTIVDRQSGWEGGLIVTRATVHVDRVMRGEAPADLVVTELGGRVGDIAQVVRGRQALPPGPRVALELAAVGSTWRVAGVLEPVQRTDGQTAPAWVRSTNKDPRPPCADPEKEVFWPVVTVHWRLDSACTPDVDIDSCEAAVQTSFQTWQDVECAYLSFAYDGRFDNVPIGYQQGGQNNVNVVKWLESGWPDAPNAHAITVTTLGCTSGRILDADILVNGEHQTFTTNPTPGLGAADIQNALTHEVGHVAGFAHETDPESTMYSTADADETKKRDLTADDADGLCVVYPVGQEPGGGRGCGCRAASAGHRSGGAAAMLALLLALKLRRIHRHGFRVPRRR